MLWFDVDKLEQVLINLISNAFKNSKKYGIITISIADNGNSITIEVHDTGKGMDLHTQQHVFDRFYSLGNPENHGIGIGLHLCKEYVSLHNGSLTLESELGKYTSFYVTLKKGKEHLPPEIQFVKPEENEDFCSETDEGAVRDLLSLRYDATVLIAEDDEDIRNYLYEELSENFKVIAVSDGFSAIKMLQEEDISIVLSDVLMPNINGFQLCKEIKKNVATSHIPVVLLTALVDDNQQIYGIAEGADEYIRKPFNVNLVKVKLIRILEQIKSAQQYFAQRFEKDKVFELKNDEQGENDEFKDQLVSLMEENYQNSEWGIDQISTSLCLSRVQFYRKVKAITGLTPVDLLRSYRLSKSVELLKTKQLTVSEIAYECGFSSPSYFTRCFKDKFGVSPSEYSK